MEWVKKWAALVLEQIDLEFGKVSEMIPLDIKKWKSTRESEIESQRELAVTESDRQVVQMRVNQLNSELKISQYNFQVELANLKDTRTHNLIITIDKINNFIEKSLKSGGAHLNPPLIQISEKEDFELYFNPQNDHSLLSQIIQLIRQAIDRLSNINWNQDIHANSTISISDSDDQVKEDKSKEVIEIEIEETEQEKRQKLRKKITIFLEKLNNIKFILENQKISILTKAIGILKYTIPDKKSHFDIIERLETLSNKLLSRFCFLLISDTLITFDTVYQDENYLHPGASIIIYFLAFTYFQFSNTNFASFKEEISIRECDLTNFSKYLEKSELNLEVEGKCVYKNEK